MHYPRGEGSKAHSKWGRIRKHNIWKMRAQRHTRKEVRLENALPRRWRLESALKGKDGMASISSKMHYYQYACILTWEIQVPFLHWLSSFLKVWVFVVSFDDSSLFLTQVISYDLNLWERLDFNTLLCLQTFISMVISYALYFCFFRKGIIELTLLCVFWIALPAWSCSQVFNLGILWGWGCVKKYFVIYKELFSWRIFEISKLFQHKNQFHVSLKQTRSEEIQVISMDMSL